MAAGAGLAVSTVAGFQEPAFRLVPAFVSYRNHSTPPGESAITHMVGAGVCVLDYDGDGLLDLFFPDRYNAEEDGGSRLYRGLGALAFDEVTERSGIVDEGWSLGCAVGDADNDGDPDLYVTRVGENGFWRNRGDGTFARSDAFPERSSWSTGAGFSDLDLDGFVDLYVCNYIDLDRVDLRQRCLYFGIEVFCGPNGLPPAPDVLYRNEGGLRFHDATRESGVWSAEGRGFSVLLTDLNSDGLPEIRVANDASMDFLFANRGGFRFEDVSLVSGAGFSAMGMEQSGMGSAAGDYDGDGDEDLYVTNFQRDYNTLFRNDGSLSFQDVTGASGLVLPTLPRLAWGAHFIDAGNDGRLDLFVANGHIYPELEEHREVGEPYRQPAQLFLGDGGGGFVVKSPAGDTPPRLGRGTAIADLNEDGGADIVVNNLGGPPDLYLSREWRGSWARIRLVGTSSNRDGLGAVIRSHTGQGIARRELRSSDGFLGSNEPVLLLGLGEAEEIARLEVQWPSGRLDRCEGIRARTAHLIKEGIGCLVP